MSLNKIIFICTLVFTTTLHADWIETLNQKTKDFNDITLITKDPTKGLILDHLATDAAIAAWGFKNWK